MLIRRGTLLDGRIADIRVGEQVVDVAPQLTPEPGEDVFDARHGAVMPGLHDHHLHVHAAAAALDSVNVGPPAVRTKAQLAQTLAATTPGADGWIRAIGYHESVAGELNHAELDALVPRTPVRVQHRSGVMWTLNSAALTRIGLAGHPDGRIRSTDTSWGDVPRREPDIGRLSRQLVAYGVTGITDATPDFTAEDKERLTPVLRQRLHCLAPGKTILYDDRLDLDGLTSWIIERHAAGVPVALHCVTVAQLVVAIAALKSAGSHPLDRIEHAAMVPDDSLPDIANLGVTVVTQPNFVAERGEQYLQDCPPDEQPQLWRVASLIRAGIPVAASTDAPFGALDPWAAMRAAAHRTIDAGDVLGPTERVSAAQALRMFLGRADRPAHPRSVEAGQPGDLCVLKGPPAEALQMLASDAVVATVIGGCVFEVA